MGFYLLQWLLSSIALMITAYLVNGFKIDSFVAALIAAIMIGFVNMFIWPVLVFLTLPLTVVTFGLFLFVVNAFALKIAAAFTPGFEIIGFWPALVGSIVLSITGWLVRFVIFTPPPPGAY